MSHHMKVAAHLREMGYRLTPQRLLILDVVKDAGHLTVDEIIERVRPEYPLINAPTVYRTLEWLKDAGLVAETDLGGNRHVYEYIASHPHHHLVCLKCGRMIELPDELLDPIREILRQDYDFEPRLDHFAFFGYCKDCQEKE